MIRFRTGERGGGLSRWGRGVTVVDGNAGLDVWNGTVRRRSITGDKVKQSLVSNREIRLFRAGLTVCFSSTAGDGSCYGMLLRRDRADVVTGFIS